MQIQNAREALREHVLEAQQATSRLLRVAESEEVVFLPAVGVGEVD